MAYSKFRSGRFGSALAVLLLGCTAISGTAQAGWLFGESKKEAAETKAEAVKAAAAAPAETLDGSIRQAQLLRVDGNYSEAIRHLSQLMMIASDDGRVISEYGKTLAAMGRAQEAVNFLTRAQQLQTGDWTVHSALGVAYDQLGKHGDAQIAYEQALALKPGEPSVLSNYALSRMLAKDPEGAQKLVARAELAGGASDPKIARNIAMIREFAPAPAAQAIAVNTPAPSPAPRTAATHTPLPPVQAPVRAPQPQQQNVASAAPRAITPFVNLPAPPMPAPVNTVIDAAPQIARPRVVASGVVMQRVPVDPLAGPVNFAIPNPPVATRAPRALAAKSSNAVASAKPAPVTVAAKAAEDLHAKAEAISKQMDAEKAHAGKLAANKPAPQPKVLPPAPAKAAEAKPAPKLAAAKAAKDLQAKAEGLARQMDADKASNKQAAAKPAAPATKTAAAKDVTPKTTQTAAAKPAKDGVPSLRLSANAY